MGGRGGKGYARRGGMSQDSPPLTLASEFPVDEPATSPKEPSDPEPPTEQEPTGVPAMKLGPAPTEDERAKLEAFVTNMQAKAVASPDDRYTAGAKRDAETRAEIARRADAADIASRLQPPVSGGLESTIRDAYAELSTKPQAWVRLSTLREKLGNPDKTEMDAILLAMIRTGRVHLAPDSDRKTLTDADHAAAFRIGREDKHLIAIEPPDDDPGR